MEIHFDNQLVVAISSRALFDFEEENLIFEKKSACNPLSSTLPNSFQEAAYRKLQLERLNIPAKPGVAFSLIQKLLAFNEIPNAPESDKAPNASPHKRVEVVILSRNDPVSGMRVFRSAQHYGLNIQRGTFTRGAAPWRYLKPLHANLFLSTHLSDVRAALEAGVPAAQVYPQSAHASDAHPNQVRIAFDGDAVLFSDEAEAVFQTQGLSAFQAHERDKAAQPLLAGPFKPLLQALQQLQQAGTSQMSLRTMLVTARSAPAHERAIRTLMNWNIEVDEAMFLGGLPKGEFLREFEPDFFFDDQTGHVHSAAKHVPSGHVVSGISNLLV